jgi:hypothetical protein
MPRRRPIPQFRLKRPEQHACMHACMHAWTWPRHQATRRTMKPPDSPTRCKLPALLPSKRDACLLSAATLGTARLAPLIKSSPSRRPASPPDIKSSIPKLFFASTCANLHDCVASRCTDRLLLLWHLMGGLLSLYRYVIICCQRCSSSTAQARADNNMGL